MAEWDEEVAHHFAKFYCLGFMSVGRRLGTVCIGRPAIPPSEEFYQW